MMKKLIFNSDTLVTETVDTADPKEQKRRRKHRNINRLNDMYAGAVMEPFSDELERLEFYRAYFPDSPEAKKHKYA